MAREDHSGLLRRTRDYLERAGFGVRVNVPAPSDGRCMVPLFVTSPRAGIVFPVIYCTGPVSVNDAELLEQGARVAEAYKNDCVNIQVLLVAHMTPNSEASIWEYTPQGFKSQGTLRDYVSQVSKF